MEDVVWKDVVWKYEDGLFQTIEPIFVATMDGYFDVWFDVEGQLLNQPSPKQWAAWDEFNNIKPEVMRQEFITGLSDLAQRMNNFPVDAKSGFGPTIYPKVIAKEAREVSCIRKDTNKTLGKQPNIVFKCDSIVVPLQDKSPACFVEINFQIGVGKRPNKSYGYELEALFCDGHLLFIGENSELWTRTDWIHEFNVPDFDSNTAMHPYW